MREGWSHRGWCEHSGAFDSLRRPSLNNRVPPALTTFAPENAARVASRVGTLERYVQCFLLQRLTEGVDITILGIRIAEMGITG